MTVYPRRVEEVFGILSLADPKVYQFDQPANVALKSNIQIESRNGHMKEPIRMQILGAAENNETGLGLLDGCDVDKW